MTIIYLGARRLDTSTDYDDVIGRYVDADEKGDKLIYVEDAEGDSVAVPVKRVAAICA